MVDDDRVVRECQHTSYVVRGEIYCADCGEMLSRNGEKGGDIVNGSQCNVCGQPATMHDLEYDEYYCDEHGESYRVQEGPHERLVVGEEPPEDPRPWTITIEVTLDMRGAAQAQREGMRMLEHIISGWDGAAGAVMNVEPNFDVE